MQEHRSFDALYDTTYTVSGPRDHYREQSRAAGFLLERCPEFKNFYSELPTHPSQTFRFKANDKLPRFISREFDPSHHSNTHAECVEKSDAANITGHHRYKYFRRPLLPGGPVALAPPEPPPPAPPAELPPGTKVTTATQSDYRETESQTIPYAPDYVIAEPTAKQAHLSEKYHMQDGLPEVLTLQHLTYTNGLPPGLAEVEMVEKQRQKRKFEANLPPLNDLNQLPLRQKLMEDWENKEWADREEEIKGLQDERLEVLQRAIAMREMRAEARTAERIEAMKATKLKEKQKTFAVIQSRRIKALRKLANARKQIEAPKESIIDEYHNYSSKVYAPQTRQGQFADLKPRGDVDPKPFEPANYKEHVQLEETLPKKVAMMQTKRPEKGPPANAEERQEASIQRQLGHIDNLLQTSKQEHRTRGHGECWPAPIKTQDGPQFRKRAARGPERPETPVLPSDPQGMSRKAAVILLQRLVRGRAVQNNMFEGKQKRLELIKELQYESKEDPLRPVTPSAFERKLNGVCAEALVEILKILTVEDTKEQARLLIQAEERRSNEVLMAQEEAAVMIQKHMKGYRTRQSMSDATMTGSTAEMKNRKISSYRTDAEEQKAMAIQKAQYNKHAEEEMKMMAGEGANIRMQIMAQYSDKTYTPEQEAAALKIQGSARMHLSKKRVNLIRSGEIGIEDAPFKRMGDEELAVKLVGKAKGRSSRTEHFTKEQEVAIVKIQASGRGMLDRKRVKAKKASKESTPPEFSADEQAAAVKIQAGARGHLARKKVAEKKKEVRINRYTGKVIEEKPKEEVEGAVIKIQAGYRGMRDRKAVKEKKLEGAERQ